MDKLVLIFHKEYLRLFAFLKDKPTLLERKGDYYRLTYLMPEVEYISSFKFAKLRVKVGECKEEPWQIVRDSPIDFANNQLLKALKKLEKEYLTMRRQKLDLPLLDFIFDCVAYGINTEVEIAKLVRMLFLNGYDREQVNAFYSAVTRRQDLGGYFLNELNVFYEEDKHEN